MNEHLEVSKQNKCISVYIDNNGKNFQCNHPAIDGDNYCVFHLPDVNIKNAVLGLALSILIKRK